MSSFVIGLLGDEEPGSIINYLRLQNWATDLYAGVELETESYDLVYVSIRLTDNGVRHASNVIRVVMQYVKILCNMDDNKMRSLWNDYIQVATLNFDFEGKTSPSGYAS